MLFHFALGLLVIGATAISGEIWGYSTVQAVVALAVLVYVLIALLALEPLIFFLAFWISATLAPMVASSTYIEFGNRISEQGVSGFASGATTRLTFYCLVFYVGIYLVARVLINRIRARVSAEKVRRFSAWVHGLHAAALAAGALLLLVHGSPLLRGVDRFAYWSTLPDIFNRFPYLVAMLSFLTTAAVAITPRRRQFIWAGSLLAASAVILLLFSEKFTGLFLIFVLSVIGGYAAALYHRSVRLRFVRLLLLCAAAAVVMLGTAAMGYMVFYGYTPATVVGKVLDRVLALNGHVWFGMDRSLQQGGPLGPLAAIFPPPGYDGLNGVQQLMYLVSPHDFVERVIASGVRFANEGMPLPVWVFGYGWSTVYFLAAGAISGAVLAYLMLSVARLRIISTLVALTALRQISNAFLVGDVTDLYKPLSIAVWVWAAADVAYTLYASRGRDPLSGLRSWGPLRRTPFGAPAVADDRRA